MMEYVALTSSNSISQLYPTSGVMLEGQAHTGRQINIFESLVVNAFSGVEWWDPAFCGESGYLGETKGSAAAPDATMQSPYRLGWYPTASPTEYLVDSFRMLEAISESGGEGQYSDSLSFDLISKIPRISKSLNQIFEVIMPEQVERISGKISSIESKNFEEVGVEVIEGGKVIDFLNESPFLCEHVFQANDLIREKYGEGVIRRLYLQEDDEDRTKILFLAIAVPFDTFGGVSG